MGREVFECWDKEDPDNVKRIQHSYASSAAELFAEGVWDVFDGANSYEIEVRNEQGEVQSFVVEVRSEPAFYAAPVRKRAATPPETPGDPRGKGPTT